MDSELPELKSVETSVQNKRLLFEIAVWKVSVFHSFFNSQLYMNYLNRLCLMNKKITEIVLSYHKLDTALVIFYH